MLRRIANSLVIIALVAAIGGHWAVLQTIAWTTMLASNLRTESFEQAVTKTFDGKHPCSLCKVVSAGKKAEKKSEFTPVAKKLEFVSALPEFVFSAPQVYWLQSDFSPRGDLVSLAPPLPPPRVSRA